MAFQKRVGGVPVAVAGGGAPAAGGEVIQAIHLFDSGVEQVKDAVEPAVNETVRDDPFAAGRATTTARA